MYINIDIQNIYSACLVLLALYLIDIRTLDVLVNVLISLVVSVLIIVLLVAAYMVIEKIIKEYYYRLVYVNLFGLKFCMVV